MLLWRHQNAGQSHDIEQFATFLCELVSLDSPLRATSSRLSFLSCLILSVTFCHVVSPPLLIPFPTAVLHRVYSLSFLREAFEGGSRSTSTTKFYFRPFLFKFTVSDLCSVAPGGGAPAQLRGDTRDGSVSAGQGIIRELVTDISFIVKSLM
jgi:hypothetical protein